MDENIFLIDSDSLFFFLDAVANLNLLISAFWVMVNVCVHCSSVIPSAQLIKSLESPGTFALMGLWVPQNRMFAKGCCISFLVPL